jgi:hypothetical protein
VVEYVTVMGVITPVSLQLLGAPDQDADAVAPAVVNEAGAAGPGRPVVASCASTTAGSRRHCDGAPRPGAPVTGRGTPPRHPVLEERADASGVLGGEDLRPGLLLAA